MSVHEGTSHNVSVDQDTHPLEVRLSSRTRRAYLEETESTIGGWQVCVCGGRRCVCVGGGGVCVGGGGEVCVCVCVWVGEGRCVCVCGYITVCFTTVHFYTAYSDLNTVHTVQGNFRSKIFSEHL